ncbi:hypothetical protein BCS86_17885 [Vibrio splendidus]|nr:hypothetical protein BCS86_17885 [Vibrio splendidus]
MRKNKNELLKRFVAKLIERPLLLKMLVSRTQSLIDAISINDWSSASLEASVLLILIFGIVKKLRSSHKTK